MRSGLGSGLKVPELPIGSYYIVDASAILEDPALDKYRGSYAYMKLESPAVFVITTGCLSEVDQLKYRNQSTRDNHKKFYTDLRQWSQGKKISERSVINKHKDSVWFLKFDISKIDEPEFRFLRKDYTDRHLLSLALRLRKRHIKVEMISRDNLLSVMCREFDIPHNFVGDALRQPKKVGPVSATKDNVTYAKSKEGESQSGEMDSASSPQPPSASSTSSTG